MTGFSTDTKELGPIAAAKKSVAVSIAGQRYVVRSDADETYVRMLAEHVGARIEEQQAMQRVVPTQKLAVLVALNIADELFQERRKRADLKQRVRDKSRALLAYLDAEERRRFQRGEEQSS